MLEVALAAEEGVIDGAGLGWSNNAPPRYLSGDIQITGDHSLVMDVGCFED